MKHPVNERSVDNGSTQWKHKACRDDEWMEAKPSKTQLRSSEIAKKTPVTFSDVRCSMVRSLVRETSNQLDQNLIKMPMPPISLTKFRVSYALRLAVLENTV